MKSLVSVCLIAFVFLLGLSWWARTNVLLVDGTADAIPDEEVRPTVTANRAIGNGWLSPSSWVPTDAERDDDRGALLTWVPSDAERKADHGIFVAWVATDAERDDDQGASLSWTATDTERPDDIGVPMRGARALTAFRRGG